MTPEQRENLRRALLIVLDANGSKFGLGVKPLKVLVIQYGCEPAEAEVASEMQYLEDKVFVTPVNKAISPENRCWRINARGRDWLAENGF